MLKEKKYSTNKLLLMAIVASLWCYAQISVYPQQPSQDSNSLLKSKLKSNMTPVRKNYLHLKEPVGPYVHAVKHNGFLFLSGITAFGSSAEHGTIAEQTDIIYSTIASIAAKENTDLSNLVKVTIYVTSFDDLESLRATLFKHYGSALPASSLVQVSRLFSPDLKIEVEAVIAVE